MFLRLTPEMITGLELAKVMQHIDSRRILDNLPIHNYSRRDIEYLISQYPLVTYTIIEEVTDWFYLSISFTNTPDNKKQPKQNDTF